MKHTNYFTAGSVNAPKDAKRISHQLSIQAGLIHQIQSGIYSILPMGQKVINNITNIIRKELDSAGLLEVQLPALQPLTLWQASGRDKLYSEEMFTLKSRDNKEFCLGPTHEEVISETVKPYINSYKNFPFCLYQISKKYRDELRPEGGLIRTKEFIMKDAYSFHDTEECLDTVYNNIKQTYLDIFNQLGLSVTVHVAETGEIGGSYSEEFYVNDIKIAHIFKLGKKYSQDIKYLDSEGNTQNPFMGCYGIGISRLMSAVIEQNHDDKGIIWPENIAPFKFCIIPIGETNWEVINLYNKFSREYGPSKILLDDRNISIGKKFKEADMIGYPFKIIIPKEKQEYKMEIEYRDGSPKEYTNIYW